MIPSFILKYMKIVFFFWIFLVAEKFFLDRKFGLFFVSFYFFGIFKVAEKFFLDRKFGLFLFPFLFLDFFWGIFGCQNFFLDRKL